VGPASFTLQVRSAAEELASAAGRRPRLSGSGGGHLCRATCARPLGAYAAGGGPDDLDGVDDEDILVPAAARGGLSAWRLPPMAVGVLEVWMRVHEDEGCVGRTSVFEPEALELCRRLWVRPGEGPGGSAGPVVGAAFEGDDAVWARYERIDSNFWALSRPNY